MISLEFYLAVLLILGAASMYYVLGVFFKQLKLRNTVFIGYDDETQRILMRFRSTLFRIVLAIIVISSALGTVNIISLTIETDRPDEVSVASFLYSLGIHVLLLLLSYLVSRLYTLASDEKEATDSTQHNLEQKLRDEKRKK